MSRPLLLPAVNLLTLGAVIALNGLAASGALSGDSIGALANRHASRFLPANRVFGIWSLIYLGLVTCAVYQWLPLEGARRAVDRLGGWWLVTGLLNIAWITLFSFRLFGAALLVMLAFLGALIVTTERLRTPGLPPAWHERLAVRWPFDLYLAWISVALISNTFQYAHVVGFGGFGIDETTWSIALMIAASLLGIVMAWSRDMWLFPLVVAWAIHGIGTRHADVPALAEAARFVVPAGVLLGVVAWGAGRVRARSGVGGRTAVGR
jgi:benzodiazapine receptor